MFANKRDAIAVLSNLAFRLVDRWVDSFVAASKWVTQTKWKYCHLKFVFHSWLEHHTSLEMCYTCFVVHLGRILGGAKADKFPFPIIEHSSLPEKQSVFMKRHLPPLPLMRRMVTPPRCDSVPRAWSRGQPAVHVRTSRCLLPANYPPDWKSCTALWFIFLYFISVTTGRKVRGLVSLQLAADTELLL